MSKLASKGSTRVRVPAARPSLFKPPAGTTKRPYKKGALRDDPSLYTSSGFGATGLMETPSLLDIPPKRRTR